MSADEMRQKTNGMGKGEDRAGRRGEELPILNKTNASYPHVI